MNRADQIIANATHLAGEYLKGAPGDLTNARLNYELGMLRQSVRTLAGEVEQYQPDMMRGNERYDTLLDGRIPVTLGLNWTPGNEQGPGYWTLAEVWIGGSEMMGYLDEETLQRLDDEALRFASPRQLRVA